MAFEDLERHLADLGVAPTGDAPASPATIDEIETAAGGRLPAALRWMLTRFGGARLEEGAFYFDPRVKRDVMIGWFLDGPEMLDALESYRERLPDRVVPIANDGADNFLSVGVGPDNAGVVYFLQHDAPDDEDRPALYEVAAAFDDFLRALHREA